jgi:undecaprenyl-diphosphatase
MVFEYIILGVVQGLTEFLPVSSSGHLVLGQELLGVKVPKSIVFEVSVHLATLLAVVCVFHRKVWELISAPFNKNEDAKRRQDLMRWWMMIAAGTVVTGVIGVGFEDALKSMFDKPLAAAVLLFVTGSFLFATKFVGKGDGRSIAECALWMGLIIGLAQGLAILPGISRSGATIAIALYLGIRRDDAGEFSFLLSIPSILGAAILELRHVESLAGELSLSLLAGFVAAFVVGYFSLKVLMKFVRAGQLHYFAWYCWGVSIVAVVWLLLI